MKVHMLDRKALLDELLNYSKPSDLSFIRNQLALHSWDSEAPIVTLLKEDVCKILQRYLDGDLSAMQVEAWAEALEMREDIAFGTEDDPQVQMCIYSLATPILEGELNRQKATEMILSLQQ